MATKRLWCAFTRLHGVIFQNVGILMFSAVRSPNLSQFPYVIYIHGKYFSVWIVKSMKYFKQNRAKECMEVCWYDVLHKM